MFSADLKIPESVEIQRHLTSIHIDDWLKHDLFHIRWWILLALIFISLTVWWILLDKSRLYEVSIYAILSFIFVLELVKDGEDLTLWHYPVSIIPLFPPLTSINLLILPLIYSISFQHFKNRNKFILAILTATALICFIIEPLLEVTGFYQLLHWNYFFSFFIYAAVAVFVRGIVVKIIDINNKYQNKI